jgi:diguanylate cyclase (GGDEF)-like protein
MAHAPVFGLLTFFLMTSALHLAVFVLMFYIYKTQKTYPGFALWTAGPLVQAVGFLAFGLYGVAHPYISMMFATLCYMVASPLRFEGFLRFFGIPDVDAHAKMNRWFAACGCCIFVVGYLSGMGPAAGVLVSSLFVGLYQAAIAAMLFAKSRVTKEPVMPFLAACHTLIVAVSISRIFVVLAHGKPLFLLPLEAEFAMLVTVSAVASLMTSVGVLFLNNSRAHREFADIHRELEGLAHFDGLTGLQNRRSFMEKAEALVALANRYEHPLTLLMCDIDHFKSVNDTYGHDGGDKVLAAVAQALKSTLRVTDQVGRLGGEEFGIVLAETNLASAKIVAEQLRQAVEAAPLPFPGINRVTISIGVTELAGDVSDLKSLLRTADEALYTAKHTGRNRWVAAQSAILRHLQIV